MATLSFADFEVGVQQYVSEVMVPLIEEEQNFKPKIKQVDDKKRLTPKGKKIVLENSPGGGHTYGGEFLEVNAHTPPQLTDGYYYPVQYLFPLDLSWWSLYALENGDALVEMLEEKFMNFDETIAKEFEMMAWNDGTGKRAEVSSVSSNTITLTTSASANNHTTKGAVHLYPNHEYDVINPSTFAVRGSIKVAENGWTPTTVTIDTAYGSMPGGITAGDWIVTKAGVNQLPTGVMKLVSNASDVVQLVSRAEYAKAKSPVVDLNSADVTVVTVTFLKAKIKARGGVKSGEPQVAFLTPGMKELLSRYGHNLIMYTNNDEKTVNLERDIQSGATVFTEAQDGPEDVIAFLDMDDYRVDEMQKLDFVAPDQRWHLKRGANGRLMTAQDAIIGWSGQYRVKKFYRHGLIKRANFAQAATQVVSFA
jgi:hypothetical protein